MFDQFKAAVTISEMARMCSLSRARFYQLIGSAFPFPVYSVSTHRPFLMKSCRKSVWKYDGETTVWMVGRCCFTQGNTR